MVDLSTLPIMHRTMIPEDYIDAMGHMNVMWYTHLFGKATVALFQQVGMDRDYFQSGRGTFALKQFFSYLVEVRFGEEITIRTPGARPVGEAAARDAFHEQGDARGAGDDQRVSLHPRRSRDPALLAVSRFDRRRHRPARRRTIRPGLGRAGLRGPPPLNARPPAPEFC